MIVVKILVGVVVGLFLHSLRVLLVPLSGSPATYSLVCYLIGVVGSYPITLLLGTDSHEAEPFWKRFTLGYFQGFAAVGLGVALGWVLDSGRDEP